MEKFFLTQIPSIVSDIAAKEFEQLEPMDAKMNPDSEKQLDHAQRYTTVRGVDHWNWFGGILYQCGLEANTKAGWNFYIDSQEQVQFATYEEGMHYNWHIDTFLLSGQPLDRKVTVICLMNDPSEFEGGELQINVDGKILEAQLKKGSVIVFPSFLLHRVTPVTKGVRKTAVMWLNGPAFK